MHESHAIDVQFGPEFHMAHELAATFHGCSRIQTSIAGSSLSELGNRRSWVIATEMPRHIEPQQRLRRPKTSTSV
jgi:hypothetical protein